MTLIDFAKCSGSIWLVTGAAGFIGSNLVEALLKSGQRVRAMDNFATGHRRNYGSVRSIVGEKFWQNIEIFEGDIRSLDDCKHVMNGVSFVLHQAGLGSVPRSISDPIATNEVNITGFLNILECARLAGVKSFVYAASSSTYGDEPSLPKVENRIGRPLSPYAATKYVNEIYADVYKRCYEFRATGLRYFNVFGPRQDPAGSYAAVIPKWTAAMISDDVITINGDGETSRDFCFVHNTVQANIKAALAPAASQGEVYNVAVGDRTSLNELFSMLKHELLINNIPYGRKPRHIAFRPGDVRHSQADIVKARTLLGYSPTHTVAEGIRVAMPWYIDYFRNSES